MTNIHKNQDIQKWLMLPNKTVYWVCQASGWSAYGILMVVLYMLYQHTKLTETILLTTILTCICAVLITNAFRVVVKTFRWFSLPIYLLITRVILATLCMSIVYVITSIGIDVMLGATVSAGTFTLANCFFMLVNSSAPFLFWSIIYFSAHFFRDYRKREIEHLRWEGAIKDFELNKLKSQLNPHFVFNALNSIRALVEEDPEKSKQAITQLSSILRNSLLADRNKTVSLAEEMRTVNDYLNLEKLRYEERLTVAIDIAPDALATMVPPMMVQTIVENAVKHGVSKQISAGFIDIEAHIDNGKLAVSIKNSGTLPSNNADVTTNATGFGLINTKQRLALLYGEDSTFNIFQSSPNIVAATISLPAKAF